MATNTIVPAYSWTQGLSQLLGTNSGTNPYGQPSQSPSPSPANMVQALLQAGNTPPATPNSPMTNGGLGSVSSSPSLALQNQQPANAPQAAYSPYSGAAGLVDPLMAALFSQPPSQ
jgi:hypothetical protein